MFWIFLAVLITAISFFAYRFPAVRNTLGVGFIKVWQVARRIWRGWLQPAILIGLVAAVVLFGLTVAAMRFGNPRLTAIVLVAWILIYLGVVKSLTISSRTAGIGLAIRSSLGSLLMLLITLAIINQILASWYGGGVFAGNAGESLIIILAITGVFFAGFLLKNPPQPFWKLCRVVIVGLVAMYFVGWGVVNVSPIKSYLASMRADIQIKTTKRDIYTEQKSLFGRLLNREKGQVTAQEQVMVFIDLPENIYTLPVYDEHNRLIGYIHHGEVVNVFLGRFASFDALQADFQSLQTVNIQSLNGPGGGIALEGYLRFRDSLSASGVPTFFFSQTAPDTRQGPKVLEVAEIGSVYLWDPQAQIFVKGAGVIPKGTKVRMLSGSRWSSLTNDEFVQVLVGSGPNGDEFEGQMPVWFLRRKLLPANPGGGGLGGPGTPNLSSSAKKFVLRNGGRAWTVPADGQVHNITGVLAPGPGEKISFEIFPPGENFKFQSFAGNKAGNTHTLNGGPSVWVKGNPKGSGQESLGVKIWP